MSSEDYSNGICLTNNNKANFMKINLRGTTFLISKHLIKQKPGTRLGNIQTQDQTHNEIQEVYFDRNPSMFHQILDYYQTGKLHVPGDICTQSVRDEISFWGIPWSAVPECCWKSFYQIDDDMEVLQKLIRQIPTEGFSSKNIDGSAKTRLWACLQGQQSSFGSKVWRVMVILSVVLSTFVYIVHGHEVFRVSRGNIPDYDRNTTERKLWVYLDTIGHPVIIGLEVTCNSILMMEWILMFFSTPNKKTFLTNFLNVTDLFACIGVWVTLAIDFNVEVYRYEVTRYFLPIVMALYTLRVFRVFRVVMNYSGMQILLLSLRSSITELLLLALAFGSFVIMFAGLIYTLEFENDSSFTNMFLSMWWAVITMTTVGYGDYFPSSTQGYIVGCVCALFGILLIAMPVAVTSSNFNDFFVFNKYRSRHNESALLSKYQVVPAFQAANPQEKAIEKLKLFNRNCKVSSGSETIVDQSGRKTGRSSSTLTRQTPVRY